jgi:hypothetical protein
MNNVLVEMRRLMTQDSMTDMSKSNYESTAPQDMKRSRVDVEREAEVAIRQ